MTVVEDKFKFKKQAKERDFAILQILLFFRPQIVNIFTTVLPTQRRAKL